MPAVCLFTTPLLLKMSMYETVWSHYMHAADVKLKLKVIEHSRMSITYILVPLDIAWT